MWTCRSFCIQFCFQKTCHALLPQFVVSCTTLCRNHRFRVVLRGPGVFKMGAKIDRRVPKSRPVRHSGRTSPCGVECCMLVNWAPAGMLWGAIFDDFIDFGSIFRWFWVVFWYILGSDTLQFPHHFDKSQGRACSNFHVFPFADSVILTYF